MTRAEALKLNKRYQLSDEVKEVLKENGLICNIYVTYVYDTPMCYMVGISDYHETICFSEVRESNNAFDRHARSVLCEFGIIAP